ncbi:MAG: SEL1-like repeat protein, partial [Desulfarculales bacterium]|nr:SEL1-like repeat protein [Desulfarculales bacterium]
MKKMLGAGLVCLLFTACMSGAPEENHFELGKGAWDRADYQTALGAFTEAAEEGNAEAMYYLAVMYQEGRGMASPNHEKEVEWLQKAAAAG